MDPSAKDEVILVLFLFISFAKLSVYDTAFVSISITDLDLTFAVIKTDPTFEPETCLRIF